MDGITAADVVVNSVTNTATHRRRLQSSPSACSVLYAVNYNLAALGYINDPNAAYLSLTQQLNSSIFTGAFDTNLHTNAALVGATSLLNVNSTAATASNYTSTAVVNGDGGDNNNGGGLSDTYIIIIAVVGGVVLLVLCALLYYFQFYKKSQPQQPDVKTSSFPVQSSPAINKLHDGV